MSPNTLLRRPAEHRRLVTFTDEHGDTTTGLFLGTEPGPREPVLILDGGRIIRRATRTHMGDRAFTLTPAAA